MYEELAIWRRMNGFDRVAEDEESCFHGHHFLPPTPEEYAATLWSEVNALKDAISMPRQEVSKLINAIEQGKLSDEEYAIFKRAEHFLISITPVGNVILTHVPRRSLSPFLASFPLLYPASSAPVSMSSGRSCARSHQSNSSLAGDASLLGGNINYSLQGGVLNSSALFRLFHPI